MRKTIQSFVAVLAVATLAAQPSTRPLQTVALSELKSPAAEPSGQPFLQLTPDGRIQMSWVEPGKRGRHALRTATLGDKRWSAPITVAEGDSFFVNWADVPSVVHFTNKRVAAHWLKKSGASTYAYDILLTSSSDGGKTWSPPFKAHRDNTRTEHGFVSLFELPDTRIGAVWLDGREMTQSSGNSHDDHEAGGDMQLRFAAIAVGNTLEQETVLDARVCECCPTSVAVTENDIVVAYRDRSAEEIRDIYVVRYVNGEWTTPRRVHEDRWQIPGCPVNGPALSARGKDVAIAWFTGANSDAQVNVAFSHDEGATFGSAIRVDDGKPLGRVDAELLPDGSVLASWIEWREHGAEFKIRRVLPDGTKGNVLKVSDISAERASGYPRMVTDATRIYFSWTETGGQKRVRVASAPLSQVLPQP